MHTSKFCVIYEPDTGQVAYAQGGHGVEALPGPPAGMACLEVTEAQFDTVTAEAHLGHPQYVDGTARVVRAIPPSPHHTWDWPTKTWLPDTGRARTARRAEVATELARRDLAPIAYAGALFDAGADARENISGTLNRLLRGDGLPAGWIGWRDHANTMHWEAADAAAVQAQLAALSRAIEDRKQALLAAAWQHKAAIAGLADVDAVLAYDLAAGWPG